MTTKTTTPPAWVARPGSPRSTTVLWAESSYAHACALGLPIGDELIAAVQRVGRASALNASATAAVQAAERRYRDGLADHVAHGAPVPDLKELSEAVAVEAVTQRARGVISHIQDEMDNDAVRLVKAAAGDWITAAKPIHAEVLDALADVVTRIPATVKDLPSAAMASRDALAAWQLVEDRLPQWTHVVGLRHRLAQLSGFSDQVLNDGVVNYRGGGAVIDRHLGGLHDATAILVGTVRARGELKPWYPSDDEIRAEIDRRVEAARERKGQSVRVLG